MKSVSKLGLNQGIQCLGLIVKGFEENERPQLVLIGGVKTLSE